MAERSDVSVGDALLFAQAQRIRELEARLSSAEEVIHDMQAEVDFIANMIGPNFPSAAEKLRLTSRRAASWSKREDKS